MSVVSGITCLVNGISSMAQWQITERNTPAKFSTSDMAGGQGRASGNTDWKGWYRIYGHTPVDFPGDDFTFAGDAMEGATGFGVTGDAIIDRITIKAPGEEGQLIESLVEFSAKDSDLTRGAASGTAGAVAAVYSACERKVAVGGADVTDTRGWTLILSAKNRAYASSETECNIYRVAGIVDAQFEYKVYAEDADSLPTAGDIAIIKFYVTDTLFWQLTWGIFEAPMEWGGDREGQEPVGSIIRGSFTGQNGTSLGTIISPAPATLWDGTP